MLLKYIKNLLLAIDQLLNALAGGDPDESISSRAAKHYLWLAKIINKLFFWQKDHCQESIEPDEGQDATFK